MGDGLIRRLRRRVRRAATTAPPATAPPAVDDLAEADREILARCEGLTMTPLERQVALLDAVDFVVDAAVPGAFVECGVWRGGSILAMILRLQQRGADPRDVYLYDTFEGMTEPTEADTSAYDRPALDEWEATDGRPYPYLFEEVEFGEQQVRDLLARTGYPQERVHFVVGAVEETIPGTVPDEVAILRLDTDWYESTRHELLHLYPRVATDGVVIIDDYGHWRGSRRAVDEYFADGPHQRPLMHRVDYACRMWTRPSGRSRS